MIVGDKVHIDTDSEEWGRVASDGHILDIFQDRSALVRVESIFADIVVPLEDISRLNQLDID